MPGNPGESQRNSVAKVVLHRYRSRSAPGPKRYKSSANSAIHPMLCMICQRFFRRRYSSNQANLLRSKCCPLGPFLAEVPALSSLLALPPELEIMMGVGDHQLHPAQTPTHQDLATAVIEHATGDVQCTSEEIVWIHGRRFRCRQQLRELRIALDDRVHSALEHFPGKPQLDAQEFDDGIGAGTFDKCLETKHAKFHVRRGDGSLTMRLNRLRRNRLRSIRRLRSRLPFPGPICFRVSSPLYSSSVEYCRS